MNVIDLCGTCHHQSGPHVLVAGDNIAVIVCPEPGCSCELPGPKGLRLPRPDFIAAVRSAVQRGEPLR